MYRSIEKDLMKWKEDSRRKPLLLRGARQVGKTYIVQKFGRVNFEHMVEVNFERRPEFKKAFQSLEPEKILAALEFSVRSKIEVGKTLLFLDEIQECPNAIMALRYFKEELPDLHVIGAGSLLEFTLNDENFRMPVGRVQFLYLYPLSFKEFLVASGDQLLKEKLEQMTLDEPVGEFVHEQLLERVREYMVLGGMPDVLEEYFAKGSFYACQEVQTDLLMTYRKDFGKYAKASQHKYLEMLFEKAPGLVAQWFKYSKIDQDVQSRELKSALYQLCDAGLVHMVFATSAAGLPLISAVNFKKFKLLFLDIGLLHRATHLEMELLLREDLLLLNRGAIAEQFVGQQFLTMMDRREAGRLFFWVREAKSSSAEVDFVLNVDSQIVPVQLRAGKLRSLRVFCEEKGCDLGLRISQAELSFSGGILSVPFYLVGEVGRLVKEIRRGLCPRRMEIDE